VLVNPAAAPLYSIFLQLELSQWLSPESLAALQARQLEAVLEHIWATVPWYHARLREAGIAPGQRIHPGAWQSLRLLTRREMQDAGPSLHSIRPPPEHGNIHCNRSSGSTGEPVEVLRSGLDQLMWQAMTLRDHSWHERDLSGALCSVRAGVKRTPEGKWQRGWGQPTNRLFASGSCATLPIETDIAEQARWLARRNPDYLLIYPAALAAVLRQLEADSAELPQLREVRTIGEVLNDGTRALCRNVFGVGVVDLYSSSEVGIIALQCPESGLYHIQSENLLVEILDADGAPCAPGSIGRVVVTTLHGFAMPLLRYDLGDYAEVAPPLPLRARPAEFAADTRAHPQPAGDPAGRNPLASGRFLGVSQDRARAPVSNRPTGARPYRVSARGGPPSRRRRNARADRRTEAQPRRFYPY
jgi:phenylacetate-CoA ligase